MSFSIVVVIVTNLYWNTEQKYSEIVKKIYIKGGGKWSREGALGWETWRFSSGPSEWNIFLESRFVTARITRGNRAHGGPAKPLSSGSGDQVSAFTSGTIVLYSDAMLKLHKHPQICVTLCSLRIVVVRLRKALLTVGWEFLDCSGGS